MYRLCVVDDEPSVRWRAQHIVRSMDLPWDTCAAEDGIQALDLLERVAPDLVLTDIRMPNMDGLAFIEQLRAAGSSTLVVMLSAHTDFAYVRQAMRLGALDYLAKPLDPADLREVLLRAGQILELESGAKIEPHVEHGNREILRRRLLTDLLEGRLPPNDWCARSKQLGIGRLLARVVTVSHPPEAYDAVAVAIKEIQQSADHQSVVISVPWDRTRTSLVVCHRDGNEAGTAIDGEEQFDLITRALRSSALPEPRIGSGSTGRIEDARLSYLESLRALREDDGRLAGQLSPSAAPAITSVTVQHAVQQACAWIDGHYNQSLTLDMVAQEVHFHPKYLCTMFPLVVGYSFGEYLAVTRIGRAKTLLAETYLHCHAIALQVGYLNERCFSQAFRRRTGLSPTEYRRANARAGHARVTSYSE